MYALVLCQPCSMKVKAPFTHHAKRERRFLDMVAVNIPLKTTCPECGAPVSFAVMDLRDEKARIAICPPAPMEQECRRGMSLQDCPIVEGAVRDRLASTGNRVASR
jgi:hypothetical protein